MRAVQLNRNALGVGVLQGDTALALASLAPGQAAQTVKKLATIPGKVDASLGALLQIALKWAELPPTAPFVMVQVRRRSQPVGASVASCMLTSQHVPARRSMPHPDCTCVDVCLPVMNRGYCAMWMVHCYVEDLHLGLRCCSIDTWHRRLGLPLPCKSVRGDVHLHVCEFCCSEQSCS